jgi:hypothetical protein
MRVCQFRHDGNLNCNAAAALRPPSQEELLFYFTGMTKHVKPTAYHGDAEIWRKQNNQGTF